MERSKSIEILEKLATGTDGRSESARLADIIEEVENALKAGVKRQSVLNALHDHYGFKMTMSGFEKALRKLRNTKTPIPITTETNNQLASYAHNDIKNTHLVAISSATKSIEMEMDLINEEDENDDESHPKVDQLKFMEELKKPPNVSELIEIDRRKKQEERERKMKDKEQASRKN